MLACVNAIKQWIHHSGSAIHNIQRGLKVMYLFLLFGQLNRILIRYPSCIYCIGIDAVFRKVLRRSKGHHVQGSLSHIGMRMPRFFVVFVELTFHCRNVDDVFHTGVFLFQTTIQEAGVLI